MALPLTVMKLAWKFLGPMVTTLVLKLGDEAFQAVRLMIKTKQSERQSQARERAEKAEQLSRQAREPGEAARLASQAQVWREVAEQYAEDNKALAAELAVLKQQLEQDGRRSVDALGADGTTRPAVGGPDHGRQHRIDHRK